MIKTIQFPLVKITLLFLVGLIVSNALPLHLPMVFMLLGLLFVLNTIFYLKKIKISFPFFEICTYLISFLIGVSTVLIHDQTSAQNHYLHQINEIDKTAFINVTITEPLKKTIGKSRYEAEINSINAAPTTGKIILNITSDKEINTIRIGSNITLKGTLYKNKSAKNPNQFDYSNYLEKKQIYAQVFTTIEDCNIDPIPLKSLNYYASSLRGKIITNLKKK